MQMLDGFLEEVKMLARDHHDSDDCRTSNLTEVSLNKCAKIIEEMNDKIEYYARMDGLASEQSAIACLKKVSKILNG